MTCEAVMSAFTIPLISVCVVMGALALLETLRLRKARRLYTEATTRMQQALSERARP